MRFTRAAVISSLAVTATCWQNTTDAAKVQARDYPNDPNWTSLGCYTDNVSKRTLLKQISMGSGVDPYTNQACQRVCLAAGFTYAGTEYATQCFCGNLLSNGGAPAASGCTTPCKGDASQNCGGSAKLNIYVYKSAPAATTSISTTSTTSKTSTTSTTSTSSSSSTSTTTTTSAAKTTQTTTTAASPTSTSTPSPPTGSKRGLAYNDNNPFEDATYANLFVGYNKISWGYDWGYPSVGLDQSFEFVPMLWSKPYSVKGFWSWAWGQGVAYNNAKNALSFNEPDLTYEGSSNIQPADAADGYQKYMMPYKSQVNIGTPSILWNNNAGPSSGGAYGSQQWMNYFQSNCTNCHYDYAALHYYADCAPANGGDAAALFKSSMQAAYSYFNLPLWLTEFQCYGTEAQQIAFMGSVLPWLDAQSYVQRYAYFGVFPNFLVNAAGNGLSALGLAYATL